MKLYLVGGAVREHLFGRTAKDLDFAVEADSYEDMRQGLLALDLHVWEERPKYVCIRGCLYLDKLAGNFGGLLPRDMFKSANKEYSVDADFTLCRAEAMYSDKRHPDVVTPASLAVDLSRRDFTVNAVAVAEDGTYIDPYNGREDAENHVLRCVGSAEARFAEDPLRMLRAIRFAVTCEMWLDPTINAALMDEYLVELIRTLPTERVLEELQKMFRHDWVGAVKAFSVFPRLMNALSWHERLKFRVTT